MYHFYTDNKGLFYRANFIGKAVKLDQCAKSGYIHSSADFNFNNWQVLKSCANLKPVSKHQRLFLKVVLGVNDDIKNAKTAKKYFQN